MLCITSNGMNKILIVEDDEILLNTLADRLSKKFTVLKAVNGQDGLSVALKEHPSLILLDNVMPVMDGMTMMKNLRKDAWGKTVSIIILTAYDTDDKMIKQMSEDMPAFYLVKDKVSLEEIEQKITEQMEK